MALSVRVPSLDGTTSGGEVDVLGFLVTLGDNTQDKVAAIAFNPMVGATSRVTAGGLAPGQAGKFFTGIVALSTTLVTTVNLEVVSPGKTFLPTDISATLSAGTASVLMQLQAAGVSIFNGYLNSTKGIEMPGLETQPPCSAGQQVSLVFGIASVASNVAYVVYGLEQ